MADPEEEVLDDLLAPRRVRDLGMKLQRVELPLRVGDRGEGGILRVRDRVEALRERGEFVAVAVPDIDLFAEAREEQTAFVEMQQTGAVLAARAVFHFAAEMAGHQLHAVADSEDRYA